MARGERSVVAVAGLIVVAWAVVTAVAVTKAQSSSLGGAHSQDAGLPINWNNPLGVGVEVSSVQSVMGQLAFTPVQPPASLGDAVGVFVSPPEIDLQERAIGWVYQSSTYGRFFITEEISQTTQQELESLAGCDPNTGCEGSWTVVTLQDGTRGLLIAGPASTGIVWLNGNLRFDVFGPPDTFTVSNATAVANTFSVGS